MDIPVTQMIHLIAALSANRVIGKQGQIPWHLPNDLAHFKALTLKQTVIMGRKTLESIGKPLPNRHNIILSRSPDFNFPNVEITRDFNSALSLALSLGTDIFIIGGESLYRSGLAVASRMYLTCVDTMIDGGDAFFPKYSDKDWKEISKETHQRDERHAFDYSFIVLERRSCESTENR